MTPQRLKPYAPLLLTALIAFTLLGDRLFRSPPSPRLESTATAPTDHHHEGSHQSEGSEGSHSDTKTENLPAGEKQKRMGIFHYNEGNKDLTSSKFPEAIEHYEMALRHNPDFEEAYINLSTTYIRSQQYPKAIETLNTMSKKIKETPQSAYNKACAHSLMGHQDNALTWLKKAMQLGYPQAQDIHKDPDLKGLQDTPAYKAWIESLVIDSPAPQKKI